MNTTSTGAQGASTAARNLRWLLSNLVAETPGVQSVAVVSSDGLLLATSESASDDGTSGSAPPGHTSPDGAGPPTAGSTNGLQDAGSEDGGAPDSADAEHRAPTSRPTPAASAGDLSTVVSGLASLTDGAARLMDTGAVKQTVVTMANGHLFVMAISDGSLLGVHADTECDMSVVAYQMALFVGRAGHVLTPEMRVELRRGMEG